MANRNVKSTFADAKAWAALHVTASFVIGVALGFVLHALLF